MISISRQDAGFNLIFLRTGLESFKPIAMRGHRADGLLIAFVVDDIDREYARLQAEGVAIATPIETEPWGERFFQVKDPTPMVSLFNLSSGSPSQTSNVNSRV
jgi:uncharacterized glyoxalase superfamily protein PhnB